MSDPPAENPCTEFGCRLEEANKRLHEWVERHDADQQRIRELEDERDIFQRTLDKRTSERDDLTAKVKRLEAEVERLYGEQGGMADWVQRSRDLEADNARLREVMGRAVADLTPDANDPDVTVNPWTVRLHLKAALEPTDGQ